MARFRIGNDITIVWNITKGGKAVNLAGKKVTLYATHQGGQDILLNNITGSANGPEGNNITFTFFGAKQTVLGRYTLTVDIRNSDGSRCLIQDWCGAFVLVGRSCAEEQEDTDYKVTR